MLMFLKNFISDIYLYIEFYIVTGHYAWDLLSNNQRRMRVVELDEIRLAMG